ncbi:MAG: ABC transporter substrate-binding protein [Lachnospira sp.]|nr:ABC transporter substrate-binding protein [Lachnospira sp.]MDD5827907.1 ABC transporter substrate-binding protein [Lachnospira sp.]
MKKFLCVLLSLVMTACVFTGCGSNSAAKDGKKKIGIVMMVENGAFTDMRDGILEEMKAKGYTDDNTIFDYKCAAGDTSALTSIVGNMTDGSYDLVFTVATPSTQALVNAEAKTPVFFCAVSAPVKAGVITDLNKPDKNATGTSNAIPVSDIFELAQSTTPAKKFGLIYSGNEDNATNTIEESKKYLDSKGIKYVVKTAPTSNDIETATNALINEGADAIFVPNDSTIQDGISKLVEICNDKKIPTYCSSATTVASGCFATLAIDDKSIGRKTADMAIEYLENGKKVSEIPTQVVGVDYCTVNKKAMDALGITKDAIKTSVEIKVVE